MSLRLVTGVLLLLSSGGSLRTAAHDNNPLEMPSVGQHELRILSPDLLELTRITTKEPDPAPVTAWNFVGENYALNVPAAAQFEVRAGSKLISVSSVGFRRRPLYAPLKKRDLRIQNSIYLRLGSQLQEGEAVEVKNPDAQLWDASFSYSAAMDTKRFSPALHVNQVGYLPGYSKKAMVGLYLGSLGEMPISATSFNLLNTKTGVISYSAPLKLRKDIGYTYTPLPYQNVYEADFTAFNTPGEYVLAVPGMGTSHPFLIHDGTAAVFARTMALGLYHQRCGGPNGLPHTRHEHASCHVAPAAVPTMEFAAVNKTLAQESANYASNPLHTAPQLKDVGSSLYPFINKGPVEVSLGHHDAGDYSKYTINSAGLIHHLVFAVDAFPGTGALDNLGLPESGDGKSDLLQEAKWEADFLAKMQDADGGFYFLVYPRDRRYEDNVLPENGDAQVVFPKTTAVTAAAVAALAEIASSPKFKAQFPTESAAYLAKAKKGWDFLMAAIQKHGKNGSYQKITHYGNEFMHDDELAWAAAAMFAATGEQTYHQQLKNWYDPADSNTRRWSWWRLFEGYGCAARTYAFAARSGRLPASALDPAYLGKCDAEIIATGNDIARFAEQTAYGTSFPDPNKSFRTAGWYFSGERAFELAAAHQLQADNRYIDALISNMNYEGGCNPVNVAYITGLGYKRARDVVHQYALNDYQVLPPTGLPQGNIQGGFAYLENYKQELGRLSYPPDGAQTAPYPYYDRWGDSFNTTTEFVVMDQARGLGAYAFLMARTPVASSPYTHSSTKITGLPLSIPAGQSIAASFEAAGADLSLARIVWEAKDQEPHIGRTFSFAAKTPGEQWVEAEALLPDGTRLFCKTNFIATYQEDTGGNAYQSAPVPLGPGIVSVYHLDGSLTDANAKGGALQLGGKANMDDTNLGWMAVRTGKGLRFYDLGDKATMSIPAGLLYTNGSTKEITLEAMVFVHAYKGWNKGSARLLSLERTWNASLQWTEDIYSGPHLRGGTHFDVMGTAVTQAMPVQKWHHLAITISSTGYSAKVNGQIVASASSSELAGWGSGTATLEFGNFDGWIDEVVIHNGREIALPAPPPAPPKRIRVRL